MKESSMSKKLKKNISLVLFFIGIWLIGWGLNEFGMFGSKLVRSLGGGIPDKVLMLWIAGAVCAVVGGVGLFKK